MQNKTVNIFNIIFFSYNFLFNKCTFMFIFILFIYLVEIIFQFVHHLLDCFLHLQFILMFRVFQKYSVIFVFYLCYHLSIYSYEIHLILHFFCVFIKLKKKKTNFIYKLCFILVKLISPIQNYIDHLNLDTYKFCIYWIIQLFVFY